MVESSPPLHIGELIAEGGFSSVFEGEYCGSQVAIKVIGYNKDREPRDEDENYLEWMEECIGQFKQECRYLQQCGHENVIQYVRVCGEQVMFQNMSYYTLVMCPLMETDLGYFLKEQERRLPQHKEIKISHQIAKALYYLHEDRKIVHGDLHLGNVLLKDVNNPDCPLVKICDFGIAKAIMKAVKKVKPEKNWSLRQWFIKKKFPQQQNPDTDIPSVWREHGDSSDDSQIELPFEVSEDIRRFGIIMEQVVILDQSAQIPVEKQVNLMCDLIKVSKANTAYKYTAAQLTKRLKKLIEKLELEHSHPVNEDFFEPPNADPELASS